MSRFARVAAWSTRGALCVCIAAAATPASGQGARRVIQGMVFDSRDLPVALVNVTAPGGVAAVSDDSGRFRLEISHRDRVVFDLRRLGYTPSRVGLAPGGDTSVSVLLLPTAQYLSGVNVNDVATKPAGLAGFEERMLARKRAAGVGYFLTAKEIEAMGATRTTQVVQNIPSLSVRRIGGEKFAIYGRAVGGGGDCLATIWLDGIRVAGGAEAVVDRRTRRVVASAEQPEIDPYIAPTDLAGVEVYTRGIIAPPQFIPAGDPNARRCAIVVLWTKHGR